MATTTDFVPQTQESALSADAVQQLKDLKKLPGLEKSRLEHHLKQALTLLSESAAEVNDRGFSERTRHRNKLRRLEKDNAEESESEAVAYDAFQGKVESTTKKLDFATRAVIDDQTWLKDAPAVIDDVVRKLEKGSHRTIQSQTQQTSDDMDLDDVDEDTNENATNPLEPSETSIALLDARLAQTHQNWTAMSLSERYSTNNDYAEFYRTVFDANNPNEDRPPLPNANEWFAQEEGRTVKNVSRGTQRRIDQSQENNASVNGDDDETMNDAVELQSNASLSDIEVQAERVRLTCPITLRYFEEPLKSTKCPHAFEKKHILEWLRKSTERAPLTPDQLEELSQISHAPERTRKESQMKPRIVRCPECDIALSEKDLRPDPILARMVKRELTRQKRAEEYARRAEGAVDAEDDSDDEHNMVRGTQRRNVVNVGSSPARNVHPRMSGKNIKVERLSMVPQTQLE